MFQFSQTVELVPDPGRESEGPAAGHVSNAQIADVLFNIATLLEMQQANPYRVAAYRNAARVLLSLQVPAAAIIASSQPLKVPGIGERLRRKITELVTTGRMTFYDDLCEESLPDDVRALMAVPHVGPRTALRLAGQMGIHSVPELLRAAQAKRLREYYGFGPRSEQRLAQSAHEVLAAEAA
jgi:DNA polymerase (family 10)